MLCAWSVVFVFTLKLQAGILNISFTVYITYQIYTENPISEDSLAWEQV